MPSAERSKLHKGFLHLFEPGGEMARRTMAAVFREFEDASYVRARHIAGEITRVAGAL